MFGNITVVKQFSSPVRADLQVLFSYCKSWRSSLTGVGSIWPWEYSVSLNFCVWLITYGFVVCKANDRQGTSSVRRGEVCEGVSVG